MKKRLNLVCMILLCGMFLFACGNAGAEEEYWLCGTGLSDGPDYTGGICEVYFGPDSIALEGSFLKSLSREDYGEQVGTIESFSGEEIEVSADCKVVQDEGNEEKSYSYADYVEDHGISETDNMAGIYTAITVKDGKVTEIYHSS